jgi:hypothetical protein
MLADAWQVGELAACSRHFCGALRQGLDGLSRGSIGAHAKRIGALDLEQIGESALCIAMCFDERERSVATSARQKHQSGEIGGPSQFPVDARAHKKRRFLCRLILLNPPQASLCHSYAQAK